MNSWHQYPFVRIILPFAAGVILAERYATSCESLPWLIIAALLLYSLFIFFPAAFYSYRRKHLAGILINILLVLLAYQITSKRITSGLQNASACLQEEEGTYIASILDAPLEKKLSWQLKAELLQSFDSGLFNECRSRILLYVEKVGDTIAIQDGDLIAFKANPVRVKNAGNPHEFDYAAYLARKGIYWQAYVKSANYQILQRSYTDGLMQLARKTRHYALNVLKNSRLGKDEFALAAAIILGYDEDLDGATRTAFSTAGAMHILCVSGLHVGIIYLFFSKLLTFLCRLRHGQLIRAFCILLIIWAYAAITGFSPSVMRASAMFSFVALGKMIQRHAYIYNTLAASAFLLLLINPLSLFEIGFQLSYLAVFFIVWLQPLFYKFLYFKNPILDKAWAIICVSLAATIGTFPLSLYHFHLFPNYFLLTNLIVIPLSFMVVFNGVLLMILSFSKIMVSIFSFSLHYIVFFLDHSVTLIEKLPGSSFSGLALSNHELYLFYLLLLLFFGMMLQRNFRLLKFVLGLMLVILLVNTHQKYSGLTESKVIVYNMRQGLGIDFIRGRTHFFLADSLARNNPSLVDFIAREGWIANRMDEAVFLSEQLNYHSPGFYKQDGLILFNNESFFSCGGRKIFRWNMPFQRSGM
ncbi:MAG: ComEC/Rec2 family competence protein [Bacteroidota bacterium]|nr:ComEC/Rec2 family competence protein [Bacteroidota bacterium]